MESRIRKLEQALFDAEQRAQRAEEEKQRAEEEKQRAEEEKQRAEEEKQRAEEQKQRAEEEKQRAEEEKQRVEEEKEKVEEEKEKVETETRRTTLIEYIQACHELVFTKFTVETIEIKTSKGSITNPAGKRCPHRLEPWGDFLEEQRRILGALFSKFPPRVEAFRSRNYLQNRGEEVAVVRVADENSLVMVLRDILAEPIRLIVESLKDEGDISAQFGFGHGIKFDTRVNVISDAAHGFSQKPDLNKLKPDQICAYMLDPEDVTGQRMAYIIEYKPPHKLTLPHLRLGLRSMNIYEDVVNRPTRPDSKDATEFFQYQADRLAAAAVTQTFDYMIEAGLTYGFLTTGEAIVFLKIDWTDPITLWYHLAEPGPEVDEHKDNFLCCTAVSQVLAFTVLALDSESRRQAYGQDDRSRAIGGLKIWKEDPEFMLQSIPSSERKPPPASPGYNPRTYKGIDRSPYLLRWNKSRAQGCRDTSLADASWDRSPEESDDDGSGPHMPETPTPTLAQARKRGQQRDVARQPRGRGSGGASSGGTAGSRQYCTQKCLLGLVAGAALDEKCPNIAFHRPAGGDCRRHPVDHNTWLSLLREQLKRTLDDGIMPLWKQGARGALFQVTLLAYGYTFVSKATTASYVPDLEHEAEVYRRLRPLQGICVPVLLGVIDLRDVGRTYYYDLRTYIIHLTFLSWGGPDLLEIAISERKSEETRREVVRSVRALHVHGVVHTDIRLANVLWNEETGRAMVIDFEQAVLLELPRPALAPVAPNKRARCAADQPNSTKDLSLLLPMQDDILAASNIQYC